MPNRFQPRTQLTEDSLTELADSIRQHGVIEPILVRPIELTAYEGTGCRYELIAGERRWRASMLAGQTTIPSLVLGDSTEDCVMIELALTENLQREDLHPLDEAAAFGQMQTVLGYSYAQIAERLGKSKGYVQNRMRLLQIDDELRHLVAERPDTLGHVYELARVTDAAERAALIAAVRDDALSRSATRARVQALIDGPTARATTTDAGDQTDGGEDDTLPKLASATEPSGQMDVSGADPGAGFADVAAYGAGTTEQDHGEGIFLTETLDVPLSSAPPGASSTATRLTMRERSYLNSVAAKVERILANPDRLTLDDWDILGPLAIRLNELLQYMTALHPDRQEQQDAPDA